LVGESTAERLRRDADADARRRELETEFQRGVEAGAEEARARFKEEFERQIAWLEKQGQTLLAARKEYLRGVEAEVGRLALDLAGKIIAREWESDPEVALPILRQALHSVSDRDQVGVRVAPERLEAFRAISDEIGLLVSSPTGVRWVPDRRVPATGVVVETEAGKLDARIDTQLEEAAALFHEVLHGRAA